MFGTGLWNNGLMGHWSLAVAKFFNFSSFLQDFPLNSVSPLSGLVVRVPFQSASFLVYPPQGASLHNSGFLDFNLRADALMLGIVAADMFPDLAVINLVEWHFTPHPKSNTILPLVAFTTKSCLLSIRKWGKEPVKKINYDSTTNGQQKSPFFFFLFLGVLLPT